MQQQPHESRQPRPRIEGQVSDEAARLSVVDAGCDNIVAAIDRSVQQAQRAAELAANGVVFVDFNPSVGPGPTATMPMEGVDRAAA